MKITGWRLSVLSREIFARMGGDECAPLTLHK
jgi:hypothetical protein